MWVTIQVDGIFLHILAQDYLDRIIVECAMQIAAKRALKRKVK